MQLIRNESLLKRQTRIGGVLLAITFAFLGFGLLLSTQNERWANPDDPWFSLGVTYAIVLVAMTFYYLGNARMRRYGPQHRHDARLRLLLKALDERYVLYAFLGRKLPDYILLGPSGVHVLTPRAQDGELTCRDDRWVRKTGVGRRLFGAFYGNPLGSPSYDTARGVHSVDELLDSKLPSGFERPPTNGLVVFTSDRARLRVERCSFTATTGKELRKVLGKLKARLNQAQLAQLRSVFEAEIRSG